MKSLTVLLTIITGVCLASTWLEVRVPVSGSAIPPLLYSFDIVGVRQGEWVELVAEEEELKALRENGIPYEIVIEDLASYYASRIEGDGVFGNYHSHDEALAILDSLHERFPEIMSERVALPNNDFENLTWNGNTVWAFKISDNVGEDEDEPEVLYTGLHHAREPIGVNITVEWARRLCEGYGTDPLLTYFVDSREIWIVPMVNPDGYLRNEETNPEGGGMYRKNLRPPAGVDINRNYPYQWGYDDVGSSPDVFSETYRGPAAGSEPETQCIMNLCLAHDFVTCVNFHSFSNLFFYPWGYFAQQCADSSVFFDWGEAATRDCHYMVSPGASGLYLLNGSAEDWMYGETSGRNKTFAVTVEVGEQFWQESEIANHLAETEKVLLAAAKAASVYPELEDLSFSDGGDGVISAGEEVNLTLHLQNLSVRDSSGDLSIKLETADPRAEIVTGSVTIPTLAPRQRGANASNPLQIKLSDAVQPDSAIPLSVTITTATEEFRYDAALPVGEKLFLLDDDFDNPPGAAWLGDWKRTDEHAHSGTYSMTDSPYSSYPDDQASYLESPKMNLSDKVTAELCFWHRHSIQQFPTNSEGQDWGTLEASYLGSDGWITLKRYSGIEPDWQEETLSLDRFCGVQDFKVRWGMISDGSLHLDGWYIDDAALTAFKGAVSTGGLHELVDIRPVAGVVEMITTGPLNFAGPAGLAVKITMFDESGRRAASTRGIIPFAWQLEDEHGFGLPSGVYFVKTSWAGGETTRKIVSID